MDIEKIKKNSEQVAQILKTIGHPKRLLILCMLVEKPYTVQELEELCEIGQSQLSQFLKRMELEGILSSKRTGRYIHYEIKKIEVRKIIESLHDIFGDKK